MFLGALALSLPVRGRLCEKQRVQPRTVLCRITTGITTIPTKAPIIIGVRFRFMTMVPNTERPTARRLSHTSANAAEWLIVQRQVGSTHPVPVLMSIFGAKPSCRREGENEREMT